MSLILFLVGVALATVPTDAVVLVVQGGATCAGALVDEQGHVATAYHCVTDGGRPRVETRDGRVTRGRVIATQVRTDLAILAVPDLAGEPWIPIRERPPEQGEGVRAIGHPFGVRLPTGFMEGTLRWSVSEGVVSAVGPRAMQFTAAVNPGNSGGPVVDAGGSLVGVVSRRLSGEGLGFAGRADHLLELLEEERAMSPLGGSVGVGPLLSVWMDPDGAVAVGVRGEVALRDRVVLGIAGALPISARWSAIRFDQAVWSGSEARLGLRQRFLHGPWSVRVDAYGGLAGVTTMQGDRDTLRLDRSTEVLPMVGGAIRLGGGGLDLAAVRTTSGWSVRTMIVLSWPGTLWVF